MANETLITTAHTVSIAQTPLANEVYEGTSQADAFVFKGGSGDDSIENFGKNDSILNYKAIFVGNNDGIIDFGPNGILDIDRTTARKAGADQITVGGLESKQLRFLGSKDGSFVYADASVRLAGMTELTVGNDTSDAGAGAKTYLYDNALGLNLGLDKISHFGADDFLVFTSKIYDSNNDGRIDFGTNGVLDLSGEGGPDKTDPNGGPGGQIDLLAPNLSHIFLDHTSTVNGVTYYYYSDHQAA